jgi:AcrR family transcriptional regulator
MNDEIQERGDRILQAAGELFALYGYDKTTVDEIAQKAGVAKGTIYLHWESKDSLMAAVITRAIMRYVNTAIAYIKDDPLGGTVGGFVRGVMLSMRENALMRALFKTDRRVFGKFLQRHTFSLMEQRYDIFREAITRLREIGIVRAEADPELMAYIINCMSYGVINLEGSSTPPIERAIEGMTYVMQRALEAEGDGDIEAGKRIIIESFQKFKDLSFEGG